MRSLLDWRDEFPQVKKSVYMYNHSLGAMPRATETEMQKLISDWRDLHSRAWAKSWLDLVPETAGMIADIINAEHGTISFHANATTAVAAYFSSIEPSDEKNGIVYSDMHFPSIKYLIETWFTDPFKLQLVKTDDGIGISLEKMLEAIDETTRLVVVSQTLYRSGYLQDINKIAEKAKSVGALVLVDAYQAAGVVPINVIKTKVDALAGGTVKWLLGGPSTGYLYVNPETGKDLWPKSTGWMAHREPFAFDDNHKFADNMGGRFSHGTPQIPVIAAAKQGISTVLQVGVERIRKHSQMLTSRLIEKALENDFIIRTPIENKRRAGTVVVHTNDDEGTAQKLIERNFAIDWRPRAGIRISPHFFNTIDDVDAIIEEICTITNKK